MVRFGAVALALGVALALTGCLQSSTPLSLPTSTHPATHSAKPSAQPIPTPTPTSTPTRFVEDCGILLTQAQVYAYNPNYVADTAYSPKAGTVAAAIKSSEGQTCGWIDENADHRGWRAGLFWGGERHWVGAVLFRPPLAGRFVAGLHRPG